MNLSNRCLILLGLLFFLTSVIWACESGRVPQNAGHKEVPIKDNMASTTMSALVYVDELVNNVYQYENKRITVRGAFMGWKGRCKTPPPVTRSDWMIENNGACIYVSGPTPPGIDRTPNSKDIGRKMDVYGKVLLTKSGTPYIQIISR